MLGASVYKTIAIVGRHNGNEWSGVSTRTFVSIDTNPGGATGFRQVASADATTFYVSGGGHPFTGDYYMPSIVSADAVSIANFSDARGIALFNGALYGSSGDLNFTNVFKVGGVPAPTAAA